MLREGCKCSVATESLRQSLQGRLYQAAVPVTCNGHSGYLCTIGVSHSGVDLHPSLLGWVAVSIDK
jgi:hypothetical protein